MKKYNGYIIAIQDRKDKTLIAENVREERADKMEMIALSRINRDDYFVSIEEVK